MLSLKIYDVIDGKRKDKERELIRFKFILHSAQDLDGFLEEVKNYIKRSFVGVKKVEIFKPLGLPIRSFIERETMVALEQDIEMEIHY